MTRHVLCKSDEIQVGKITRALIGHSPVLLCRLPSGEVKAIFGRCPHHGADLTYGCIAGMTRSDMPNSITYEGEGEILRCPWHGFEFHLSSGKPLVESAQGRPMHLRFLKVEIESDRVILVT